MAVASEIGPAGLPAGRDQLAARALARGGGREYWDSWVEAARTDPAAAAAVRRYHCRPPEELYDLEADPWELSNLASDPVHATTLARLRADLDAWMMAQGDAGLATERALPDPRKTPRTAR